MKSTRITIKYGILFALLLGAWMVAGGQFTSHLPIVSINTDGQWIPEDDPRIIAWMGVIDNGAGQENHLSDPFNEYAGQISIELRGSSSLMFPKNNFSLETQDSLGENLNVPLLGLPDENDWVLHGPYSDKTLMRNVLTFRLANDLGGYASRTRYCELFLNDDYRG
ncbi:MAG: CotH kinase family protein, partial [Bacteroidales bacterium]|nr:CotH kinase family protein [Bacteroidales bacterium]